MVVVGVEWWVLMVGSLGGCFLVLLSWCWVWVFFFDFVSGFLVGGEEGLGIIGWEVF